MIAQRIASVRDADRIAVIESDGRILHCASHEELLVVSETYRDICASQRQSESESAGGEAYWLKTETLPKERCHEST